MEKGHFKKHFALYLCLVLANLAFIWGNSLVPGDVSGEISGGIFEMVAGLFAVFGDNGQLVLRKLAHFSEFTALGFFLTGLWRNLPCMERIAPPLLLGLAAACLDETIQIFSPGRGSSLIDVWIDFSGVCLGFLLSRGLRFLLDRRAAGKGNRKA